ncbi:hypothetical protein ACS0TY_020623 [Phlomoides rotata]
MRTVDRKNAMNMLLPNTVVVVYIGILILTINKRQRRTGVHRRTFTILDRIPAQMKNMSYLCEVSDEDCRDKLRMDRATFDKVCFILQSVCGLKSSRRVCVPEKVAMFLSILAHHTKNRCVKFAFKWSGQTVSKHFHAVLNNVLMLHDMFLVRPQPINEDNTDPRWHQFKGCLGALDGTYSDVLVSTSTSFGSLTSTPFASIGGKSSSSSEMKITWFSSSKISSGANTFFISSYKGSA